MSSNNIQETRRKLSILQETTVASSLIESGLAVYQGSQLYKSKPFVFLTLLSSGIERLMKAILIVHTLEAEKRTLTKRELQRDFSHNIIELHNKILDKCFTADYLTRPNARSDYDFLKNDTNLKEILEILADFAKGERYIYMDGTSNPDNIGNAPDKKWDSLEMRQISSEDFSLLFNANNQAEAKRRCVERLTIYFEKYIRALTRLFSLAELGEFGRSLAVMPEISSFSRIDDENLGTKKYEL